MYILILITCVHLQCEHLQVMDKTYDTLTACEAAMEAKYDEIEPGQGLLCIKAQRDKESVRT